jgi:hypothetical protein
LQIALSVYSALNSLVALRSAKSFNILLNPALHQELGGSARAYRGQCAFSYP